MSRVRDRRGLIALMALIALTTARVAASAEAQRIPLGPYHSDGTAVIMAALAAVPDTAVLYAAGDDGLYRSADAGAHWTNVFADPIGLFTVAVDPLEPSTVYAGSLGGLFRSTDSGAVWTKVLDEATSALAFDPSGALYAGTAGLEQGELAFVLRTDDRGASWTSLLELRLYERVTVLAVDPVSPENLYAGTNNRALYRTTDGGASWSAAYEGYGTISSVAVHPHSNTTLYAASRQTIGFPENPFHCNVVRSADFGHTWETLLDPTQDCGFSSVAIEPFGRHRLLVSLGDTLSLSNDAGGTFSPVTDEPIYVAAYAFDRARPGHFYVAGVGVSEIILAPSGRGIEPPASSPPPPRALPPRPIR